MRVTIQILDTVLDNLENSKSRCHSIGYQAAGCVANFNYAHISNVLYPVNIISKFTMLLRFCITKRIFY